ncbi:MAG TPA: DNA alkylation repair protein [Cyclobacteriaceae bacterium]
MNLHHKNLLNEIKKRSGKPTQHTFVDSYLGNTHPRYPINAPTLRGIAKEWIKNQSKDLSVKEFTSLLTSLIEGESATEKTMAGILLDYSPKSLRGFDPLFFDKWLDHLQGWAEVDSLCTGKYTITEIPKNPTKWKKLLNAFSKSKHIEKRRASLVLLCSPLSQVKDEKLIEIAFENINRLKGEKEILITKAISWLLRSAVKHYKKEVHNFITSNADTLPKIAVRETIVKLKTGKKTKSKTT